MEAKPTEQSFSPGDVVYCIAGNPEGFPAVEKATVDSAPKADYPDALPRHELIVWDQTDKNPEREGVSVTKSPGELFTKEELETMLKPNVQTPPRYIDNLLNNPATNHKLTLFLSHIVIDRLTENPQDLIDASAKPKGWHLVQ